MWCFGMSSWGQETLVGFVLPSMELDWAVKLFADLLQASCVTRETMPWTMGDSSKGC